MQAYDRSECEQPEKDRQDTAPPTGPESGGILITEHLVNTLFEHGYPRLGSKTSPLCAAMRNSRECSKRKVPENAVGHNRGSQPLTRVRPATTVDRRITKGLARR